MDLSLFVNPLTSQPHIFDHHVSVGEIVEFFSEVVFFERERKDGSFVAYGILKSGRILTVAFRKVGLEGRFIITAYDTEDPDLVDFLIRNTE